MAFYESIQNPSSFVAAATKRQAQNFRTLSTSTGWETAASSWSTQQLYASRLICKPRRALLPILEDKIRWARTRQWNRYIDELIAGPRERRMTLAQMSEPEIVQTYETNGLLGTVWAALAPLLKEEMPSEQQVEQRSTRIRGPPETFAPYTSSSAMQIGSSPPEAERPATASSQPRSIGYHEYLAAPLLEDNTMQFASSFIRYIINYGQPMGKSKRYIQYRDERLIYKAEGEKWEAIDDGGMQIIREPRNTNLQVAVLEAKRAFQQIIDGKPIVSDDLLGQVTGEVLALRLSNKELLSAENIVAVVLVKHYVKFFQFNFSSPFLNAFSTLKTTVLANQDTYLAVESTEWLDANELEGRRSIVHHVLALLAWADSLQPRQDEERDDGIDGEGDDEDDVDMEL